MVNAWDIVVRREEQYQHRPAPVYVRRGASAIQAHELTKAQLPGYDRAHKRDNAFLLAERWGESAIERMQDACPEEIGYYARCAAHFANLALKFRQS